MAGSAALTRRAFLKRGGALAALAGVAPLLAEHTLRALAAPAAGGSLGDIDHVVIFMQENRSFDHYFGTLPGVRGFGDPAALPGVFDQRWTRNTSVAPVGRILPFHLQTAGGATGMCTNDVGHSFDTQHQAWNHGAMDRWGEAHAGDSDPTAMGYYTRDDIPYSTPSPTPSPSATATTARSWARPAATGSTR